MVMQKFKHRQSPHEAHIDVRALQPAALNGRPAASLEVGHQLGEERLGKLVPMPTTVK